MPQYLLLCRGTSCCKIGETALEGCEGDFDVLMDLGCGCCSYRDHVAVANHAPVEIQSDKRSGAAGGKRLDCHNRLFGVIYDPCDAFDLYLHQKSHAVENLDIRFDIIAVCIAVKNRLRHMGGETRKQPRIAYHRKIVGQADDFPEIFIYQLLHAGMVDKAEG